MEMNLNNRSALYRIADCVKEGDDVSDIINAMRLTLNDSYTPGIGLAAPQIGASKRIIIICTSGLDKVIINPVITRRRLGKAVSMEGCLSFPGRIVKMKRDKQIIVEGLSINWKPIKLKLRGIDSFVVQHEIDHLDGITITNSK